MSWYLFKTIENLLVLPIWKLLKFYNFLLCIVCANWFSKEGFSYELLLLEFSFILYGKSLVKINFLNFEKWPLIWVSDFFWLKKRKFWKFKITGLNTQILFGNFHTSVVQIFWKEKRLPNNSQVFLESTLRGEYTKFSLLIVVHIISTLNNLPI